MMSVPLDADLLNALRPYLAEEQGPGPGSFLCLNAQGVAVAAEALSLKPGEAMAYLLEREIWPRRFSRNRGVFTAAEQAKLLKSTAAVIGCGGLGGQVAALLARVGLGALIVCDYDVFDESNLNRQFFSRESALGRNKAEVAAEELADVASHVRCTVWREAATAANLPQMLAGADVVMDCLDSIAARLLVEKAAQTLNIPMVYASIAGEEAFTMLTRPGEPGPAAIYGENPAGGPAAEKLAGAPTLIPAAVAPLQVNLALRALLGRPPEGGSLYHLDLSVPSLECLLL